MTTGFDSAVVGMVDVMDLIYRCGGTQGWRATFNDALNAADDLSEADSAIILAYPYIFRTVRI